MGKKILFGSNLKMYKGVEETISYLQELQDLTKEMSRAEMELFIIPSYVTLERAVKAVDTKLIKIGAQNMCWEDAGQFTGEISPVMLKELGVSLVMIGHSERRHVFGETDVQENQKVLAALQHGFTTLLCIGETAEEKGYGISKEILRIQLKKGLHQVSRKHLDHLWIAYEPVWSIGVAGVPATVDYVREIHQAIKESLEELFGADGANIPVLYGGSVNADNANEMIVEPLVDGLFVGRSAWQADKFSVLLRAAKKAKERG
ncbi:MAG: triose-phosphate isomerase [Lachnospiraceae bacterium]|nr:triose-phosphate isomerase [Lachnospiraceae bacterium]